MASIHSLAPEIISYILLLGSDSLDLENFHAWRRTIDIRTHGREPKPFARVARAVCSRWNQIVETSLTLWVISLAFLDESEIMIHSDSEILTSPFETWIKNDDKSDIDIFIRTYDPEDTDAFVNRTKIFIQNLLPRIRIFVLNATYLCPILEVLNCNMPRLLGLSVSLNADEEVDPNSATFAMHRFPSTFV